MAEDILAKNILGTKLKSCYNNPNTGYFRDGFCNTSPSDLGLHVVCSEVTDDFLNYSLCKGNDLKTPSPNFGFPGLKPGDKWCLCASRWKEAYDAGVAPPIIAEATNEKALETIPKKELLKFDKGR